MFFSGSGWEISQDQGKDEWSKAQRDFWWKLAPERSGPLTGAKVHLPKGQQPNRAAKITQEWLRDNVPEWPSQSPDLNPDPTFLERPENSCVATLPIQPDRAWEYLLRRMGETPQIQVCQACSVILKKTGVAAIGASTKCLIKGQNSYVNVIFQFLFVINLQRYLKPVFLCHYGVLCVDWWRGKTI